MTIERLRVMSISHIITAGIFPCASLRLCSSFCALGRGIPAGSGFQLLRAGENASSAAPAGCGQQDCCRVRARTRRRRPTWPWGRPRWGMIVSASYKTDIRRSTANGSAAGWTRYCKMRNPYGGQVYTVRLKPEDVDAFVFWTKNAGPFLDTLDEVRRRDFRSPFNMRSNGYPRELEWSVTGGRALGGTHEAHHGFVWSAGGGLAIRHDRPFANHWNRFPPANFERSPGCWKGRRMRWWSASC